MLGDVPNDWDIRPLRRLLSANFPGDWGEERGPQMTRVLRSTNLTNDGRLDLEDVALRALAPAKAESLTPRRHDILLERSGGGPGQPVGRVAFVQAEMPGHGFSNFLHLLRPDTNEVDARFLGWVLYRVNRTGRVVRLEQQTTQMRNLHFRDYLTMPLPVPPPGEQVGHRPHPRRRGHGAGVYPYGSLSGARARTLCSRRRVRKTTRSTRSASGIHYRRSVWNIQGVE